MDHDVFAAYYDDRRPSGLTGSTCGRGRIPTGSGPRCSGHWEAGGRSSSTPMRRCGSRVLRRVRQHVCRDLCTRGHRHRRVDVRRCGNVVDVGAGTPPAHCGAASRRGRAMAPTAHDRDRGSPAGRRQPRDSVCSWGCCCRSFSCTSSTVQSFGWTIQFHVPTQFLAQASLLILTATTVAGLYPARLAGRFHIADLSAEG